LISSNPEIHSRNRFAQQHAHADPDDIAQRYTHLSLSEFAGFMQVAFDRLGFEPRGVGVELGAGTAVFSNTVARIFPGVERIYAVEIVPDVVARLQARITGHFGQEGRVLPVIGSFDELQLSDGSVDFIVEFDSLHHSNDLDRTLREAARVLRKGGKLVAFDRVNFDSLTEEQREFMLNREYSADFKKEYGLPVDVPLTRRENGEHEICEGEWRAAFARNGFAVDHMTLFHRRSFRGFVYAWFSQIPYFLRRRFDFYPMLVRFPPKFLLFYLLPFLSGSGGFRIVPQPVRFARREAFLSKTAIIATRQ
jgi:ubiquinone/menaquinone biosynthesis C-methylase UbiE